MFNMSGSEIIVILLLALVVLGPEKLPDALRRAGRTYSELKKMGNSFQSEMKSVLDEPMKEMRDTADLLKKSVDFTDGEVTATRPVSPRTPRPTVAPPAVVDTTADTAPPTTTPDAGSPVADAGPQDVAPAGSETVAAASSRSPDDELIDRTLSGNQ